MPNRVPRQSSAVLSMQPFLHAIPMQFGIASSFSEGLAQVWGARMTRPPNGLKAQKAL
jgi:hypothetical protein